MGRCIYLMGLKRDEKKKKAMLIDIDGTLVIKDTSTPIQPTVDLVNKTANKYKIVIITFRKQKKRKETVALLRKLGIPFDMLVMRPKTYSGDVDPAIYKAAVLEAYQQKYDVFLGVDDYEPTLEAYRKMGIKAIHPKDLSRQLDNLTKIGWTGYTF